MNPLFYALAFAAGAAIAAQAAVNSQLAASVGGFPIAAAFISFAIGTLALGAIAAATGSFGTPITKLADQPAWHFTGGLLGAGAIFCTVLLAPRLGLATLLALVIAGQLLTSIAIDHFGLIGALHRPATTARIIGATTMLLGVLVALFGDRLLQRSMLS